MRALLAALAVGCSTPGLPEWLPSADEDPAMQPAIDEARALLEAELGVNLPAPTVFWVDGVECIEYPDGCALGLTLGCSAIYVTRTHADPYVLIHEFGHCATRALENTIDTNHSIEYVWQAVLDAVAAKQLLDWCAAYPNTVPCQ